VVAEIRGREKPNEFVVIGAHLDSWELGTGALDNGCNAALTIEALRAIKAAGLQPRRTIRFVLFTGEEEINVGSFAYTTTHKAELDNTVAMLTWDEGTGKTTGFSLGGRKDLVEPVTRLLEPSSSSAPTPSPPMHSLAPIIWIFFWKACLTWWPTRRRPTT